MFFSNENSITTLIQMNVLHFTPIYRPMQHFLNICYSIKCVNPNSIYMQQVYVVIDFIRTLKFKAIQLETDNNTCVVQHSRFFSILSRLEQLRDHASTVCVHNNFPRFMLNMFILRYNSSSMLYNRHNFHELQLSLWHIFVVHIQLAHVIIQLDSFCKTSIEIHKYTTSLMSTCNFRIFHL